MVQESTQNTPGKSLRKRAESLLNAPDKSQEISRTEVLSLIHELQIHQVELEMQNEELRQSQLSLSESRDQYCELYDCAPVAYLTLDQNGVILDANLKATEMLARDRKHIIGHLLANFIAPDSQDDYYLHRKAVFSSDQKQVAELAIINSEASTNVAKTVALASTSVDTSTSVDIISTSAHRASTIVRIESIAKTLATTGNAQSHTVLIDVTNQKHAERALEAVNQNLTKEVEERTRLINIRSEELLAILNAATDAIITIDSTGIIETVNPATESMFGYFANELVGNNISLLLPEPQASAHQQHIKLCLTGGHSRLPGRSTEMTAKRKDNTLFPVSLAISRVDHEPRFTEIIRDMTDRVQFENQVLQSVEDERNRISRELHDTVSQSLVGIAMKASSLSDLLEKIDSKLARQMAEFSQGLARAGQEVHTIVKDLAALQLDDNRLEDYFINLVAACRTYSKAEINLHWLDDVVIEEPFLGTQLFRITQEALHNAIKHANSTLINIKVSKSLGLIKLVVTDNGVGLASDNASSSELTGLTGLGINNMKYRAHVIGASLDIKSDKHGTTVECTMAI